MKKLIFTILFIITANAQAVPLGSGTGRSDSITVKDFSQCELLSRDEERVLISQSLERAIESAAKSCLEDFPTSRRPLIRTKHIENFCVSHKEIETTKSSTVVFFETSLTVFCVF